MYFNMFYCELMQIWLYKTYRVQYAAFVALSPLFSNMFHIFEPSKEGNIVSAPAPLVCIGSTPTQEASHHQNYSTFNRGALKNPAFPAATGWRVYRL